MLKWVVTRGPSGTTSGIASSCPQSDCNCNKENLTGETTEMENNNSYTCQNFETHRPNLTPRETHSTPLTSRNPIAGRAKKLRTRRDRNKTLIKRLSATSLTNLSEIATPASPRPQLLDPIELEATKDAQLLQHILNTNRLFNEREVKTPEEPSPLGNGKLCRQRAVRRKHSKAIQPVHHRHPQVDPYDSASIFNCFVFRELAQEMLI